MNKYPLIPAAQREVWEWKNEAYRSVAHLPRQEALSVLLRNAATAAKASGLVLPQLDTGRPALVAETGSAYNGRLARRKHASAV